MIVNVKDFGAVGNGVTDDALALQTALATIPINGGELYFPAGNYNINSMLDLSNRNSLTVRGEGIMAGGPGKGSSIIGNIPDDLVRAVNLKSFLIHGMSFRNVSALGQSALHVEGMVGSVVEWCQFASKGKYGLYAPQNTFSLHIKNSVFNGSGNTGIGAMLAGHTTIQSCDVSGWDDGIRAYGAGVNILGCRLEVNKTAMKLGQKADGNGWILDRSLISGNSFEANDIGIDIVSLYYSTISASSLTGTTGSPAGGSKIGINVRFAKWCTFQDLGVGGTTFTDKGVKILGGEHLRFRTTQIQHGLFVQPGLVDVEYSDAVTVVP